MCKFAGLGVCLWGRWQDRRGGTRPGSDQNAIGQSTRDKCDQTRLLLWKCLVHW